jgi:high-affinity iron transporter
VPEERLASAVARERGRALYVEHCVLCHGIKADGQGVRQVGLSTRARDFTSPYWRREATPRTVYFAIREGVAGTAMPSWKSLDETDAWDLVAFLLSVGEPEAAAKQGRAGGPSPEKFAHEEPGSS